MRKWLREIWYLLRCGLCEEVFGWAMKLAPKGYVPSWIEMIANARRGVNTPSINTD